MKRTAWILLLLTPGIGLILFIIGAVFYIAVAQSFGYYNLMGESGFSLEHWWKVTDRKAYWRTVRYSLYIGTISAIFSVALAYPLALWLRKPFRGSLTVSAILKMPLLIHGIVAAFLFLNIISYHGVLNQFLVWIGVFSEPQRLQNDKDAIGLLIMQVWKNMPFALLLLTGAVQAIGDAGRETGDIDVLALGFDRLPDVPEGVFMPLDMLPEDDGRITTVAGIDGGNVAVAYWGNQTGIAYDPEKISEPDLPQNPDQLAAFWEANPGQFAFNYENGGSGPSFYMNVLRTLSDLDFTDGTDSPERLAALNDGIGFFNEHAENYEITASNADSLTRISDGEFTLVAAWEDHLAGLQNNGEVRKDIKFYIPEMGMFGGGNASVIPANAPHPAAAAVLVNWLSSPEVQTQFNIEFGTAPMHAKADDSAALVSSAMRDRQTAWTAKPFRDSVEQRFIEDVVQER